MMLIDVISKLEESTASDEKKLAQCLRTRDGVGEAIYQARCNLRDEVILMLKGVTEV